MNSRWIASLVVAVTACSGGGEARGARTSDVPVEPPQRERSFCADVEPGVCFEQARQAFSAFNDWNRLAPIYEHACIAGVFEACADYGEFWVIYRRPPTDPRVFEQLNMGCEAGVAKACLWAAVVPSPTNSALLERGCELGAGLACAYRGLEVLAESRDSVRASEFYEKGCSAGDGTSCYALAGQTEDPARAKELEQRACELEKTTCEPELRASLEACREQGFTCAGLGLLRTAPNEVVAVLEAACRRQPSLCTALGDVYSNPADVGGDRKRAVEAYRQACMSDEKYVLYRMDRGCERWVELACLEDLECPAEMLDAIATLNEEDRPRLAAAFHCANEDAEATRKAIAACDCDLVCEKRRIRTR